MFKVSFKERVSYATTLNSAVNKSYFSDTDNSPPVLYDFLPWTAVDFSSLSSYCPKYF